MNKTELKELISQVVTETIITLKRENFFESQTKPKTNDKTAYAKTESLLYNYNNFKKILEDRKKEIEELRKYGVPASCAISEYVQKGGMPKGLVLDEERVDAAVANVQASVQGIVQALELIDKCMATLGNDPYYKVLPMRYFEGRTLEDIGVEFGKDTATISRNRVRLVKELSMRLFPDQYINELMN